jgi:hypothetical protein
VTVAVAGEDEPISLAGRSATAPTVAQPSATGAVSSATSLARGGPTGLADTEQVDTEQADAPSGEQRSASPGSAELLDGDVAPIFAGLVGLTLLGGYLYRARSRRRRTALRNRRAGRRPKPPPRRTRSVSRRLAAAAEPEFPEFVNTGLRAMGRLLEEVPADELPTVSGVWVSRTRLVIALTPDSPRFVPPSPFTEFADGSGWSLHHRNFDEARRVAKGANGPLPLLTTVGTTTALDLALTTNSRAPAEAHGIGSSLLFAMDIEAGRVISVRAGDEASTIEALTMMALELATAETADQVEVVCVGFGHRLATFDRVMVVDDLAEVLSDLETITGRAVYAAADASPFATRVRNGAADTWNPVVVFHADGFDPHSRNLIELADRVAGGVTAVCGYPTESGWSLNIDGGKVRCPDLPGDLGHHEFTRPTLDGIELVPDLFDEPEADQPIDDEFWRPVDPVEEAHTWHLLDTDDIGWRPMGSVTHPDPPSPPTRPTGRGEPSPGLAIVVNRADAEPEPDPEDLWDSMTTIDPEGWPGPRGPVLDHLQHSVEHRTPDDDPRDAELDRFLFDTLDPSGAAGLDDDAEQSSRHLYVVESDDETTQPSTAVSHVGPAVERSAPTVTVSVLGNFTIGDHLTGAREKPWKYTKTAELILYLLLHPGGASQDLLMEQLFPDQAPNRPRLNQLVSDARTKALGKDANGEYYLPHASPTDPFYRLDTSIGFDLTDFTNHCAAAKASDDPDQAKTHWQSALDLVQGRPFTLPHDGYEWARPEIEATIVKVEEAALALADIATDQGDHQLAVWATRKGLLTGTGYYELLVRRGRAALLLQDPEEIVRAFADLQVSLEHTGAPEEGVPDLSAHPELEGVYNDLSGERSKDRPT